MVSDSQYPGTDQVRQPPPLFGRQECVNLLQSVNQGLTDLRSTLYTAFTGATGLRGIKSLAGDGIGKLSQGATVVHLGLSAVPS